MQVQLDCIPCFQRQALQAARFVSDDPAEQERVLREIMGELLALEWDTTPPTIAHVVHRRIRRLTGHNDPYADVKQLANTHVLDRYPHFKSHIQESDRPLSTALKLAIIGNVIDFGALASYDLESAIAELEDKPLIVDDSDRLFDRLTTARSLLYFADNTGEIVFDRLFLETMLAQRDTDLDQITFVVKGGPIINDATLEDVKIVGLDRLPQIKFRTIGTGEPDTGPARTSETVQSWIKAHDIAIAKGQGNYEAMNTIASIYFLLMVKCPIVARDLAVDVRELVCWYSGDRTVLSNS